ncbi:AraC family transcriptional regulator [Comamonas testosteroni]|nr:AraC family transcriptional regulator [Comamonas testosteroni]
MSSSLPALCVIDHRHSDDVEPALRREAWREVAHWQVEFIPSPDVPLNADMHMLRSSSAIFGSTRSSAYDMRTGFHRAEPLEELVVISLIEAGDLRLNAAPGEPQHMETGSLGLFMPRLKGHYRWSHNARQAFIDLPRREVLAAMGKEPGNFDLSHSALAPMVSSQLAHLARLARRPGQVDTVEQAGLLDVTRSLTLLALRNLGREGEHPSTPDPHGSLQDHLHRGRHAAAMQFMQREAHRHDLDAAAIANGTGCSRTRLYEAFAFQDQTVMGELREIRLQLARELLEQTQRLNVGALAWRCGFASAPNFAKLFRARFGLSPSEWYRRT